MSEFLAALGRLLVVLYNGPEGRDGAERWGHWGHNPRERGCPALTPPPTSFKAALWHLVRDSAATLAHGFLL